VIIFFAAYQATRAWEDLIALFVLGFFGMYMKRFGWSRPAFLIGFVLSMQLDASVYQSIQVYGMSFLERGGVQVILALIVISLFVAARMKPHRDPLTAEGPYAPVNKTPQAIFMGLLISGCLFTIYDVWHLEFLGKVFPMSVALITLALLAAAAVLFGLRRPNYIFFDSEREFGNEEKPVHGDLHFQAWILALLAAIGLFGYMLGIFVYITTFLRVKAGVRWLWAIGGALGAVTVLTTFGYFLALDYPKGLLQAVAALPWPFD
jgi:hypothetical protein